MYGLEDSYGYNNYRGYYGNHGNYYGSHYNDRHSYPNYGRTVDRSKDKSKDKSKDRSRYQSKDRSRDQSKDKPLGRPMSQSASTYTSMFGSTTGSRSRPRVKQTYVPTDILQRMLASENKRGKPKENKREKPKELTEEEILAKEMKKLNKRVDEQLVDIKASLTKKIIKMSKSGEQKEYIDVIVWFNNKCGCKLSWLCKQQEGECETSAKQYLRGPDDLKHGSVANPEYDKKKKDKSVKKFKYDVSKKVFQKLLDEGHNVVYVRKCVQIGEDHDGNKRKFWAIFAFDNYFRFYLNEDSNK
jgi:hypothetical protein